MDHLATLAGLKPGINCYTELGQERKRRLHASGKKLLQRLAADLGLAAGTYDIRSNLGGVAVSGEVTLHADRLYVQLFEACFGGGGVRVLYRTCQGRGDYCGGVNHQAPMSTIAARWPSFVAECRHLIDNKAA